MRVSAVDDNEMDDVVLARITLQFPIIILIHFNMYSKNNPSFIGYVAAVNLCVLSRIWMCGYWCMFAFMLLCMHHIPWWEFSHSNRIWNRNILCSPPFLCAPSSHSHFVFLYPIALYFICCHVFPHKRTNTYTPILIIICIIYICRVGGWWVYYISFSFVVFFASIFGWSDEINCNFFLTLYELVCLIWWYSMPPYECERIWYISYMLDIKIIAPSSRCIQLENKWHTFACWFENQTNIVYI